MAKYQKAENCGPVPYPDRSGRFLVAGETVEGDDWEPLVALRFVVKVAEVAAAPAKAAPPKEEPKAAILQEDPQGVSDVVSTNDGAAAEAVTVAEEKPAGRSGSGRKR
jgi:hypothetical protein